MKVFAGNTGIISIPTYFLCTYFFFQLAHSEGYVYKLPGSNSFVCKSWGGHGF